MTENVIESLKMKNGHAKLNWQRDNECGKADVCVC